MIRSEMKIKFCEKDPHLDVICEGAWESGAVTEMLISIKEHATQTSHNLILLNCFKVSAPIYEFDRFLAGKDVAEILGHRFKLAVLYPKNLINKFAENVAVNRGARFFVSFDEDEALEWLHQKGA
jgi:hypothetical protein